MVPQEGPGTNYTLTHVDLQICNLPISVKQKIKKHLKRLILYIRCKNWKTIDDSFLKN